MPAFLRSILTSPKTVRISPPRKSGVSNFRRTDSKTGDIFKHVHLSPLAVQAPAPCRKGMIVPAGLQHFYKKPNAEYDKQNR